MKSRFELNRECSERQKGKNERLGHNTIIGSRPFGGGGERRVPPGSASDILFCFFLSFIIPIVLNVDVNSLFWAGWWVKITRCLDFRITSNMFI